MTKRLWLLLVVLALVAVPLAARVGGGEGFSGGGGGGGGSSDGGGEIAFELIYYALRFLIWLTINHPAIGIPVDIVVIIFVIRWLRKRASKSGPVLTISPVVSDSSRHQLEDLRKFDPNFSEVVFTDFCYSLYARVHHARGEGKLDAYAPYVSAEARATLKLLGSGARVEGIVIGGFTVTQVRGLDTAKVFVTVEYESNYTELAQARRGWYVKESWTLERDRDLLSPTPDKAKAEHCPKCGGALQTRTDGACSYCGAKIDSGAFHWYVRAIQVRQRTERPPNLMSSAPERGTELPTRRQSAFERKWVAFKQVHPAFDNEAFKQRVRMIATELQQAWTDRQWERARAFETDSIFQMHRYWIDEYRRQSLRNVVDAYEILKVEPVKIVSDAFYDAVTVRLSARGYDHTDDASGKIVAGSKTSLRTWTEYWTLIRGRGAGKPITVSPNCPNCGAPLQVSETGICAYCNGKITSGEFDWVLSRIEQDESYTG